MTAAAIAHAALTARSAWSGNGSGAPNTASRPSPSNLSTWPPCSAMIGTITSNSPLSAATTCCGVASDANAVKSRTSQNRTVTSTSTPSSEKPSERMYSATSSSR